MTPVIDRRRLAGATLAAATIATLGARRASADAPRSGDDGAIAAIERRGGGRLGVFARDTGSGRVLAHRADERFQLASTFKGPLAAMVLSRVDHGEETLATPVRYGRANLLPASPVSAAHVTAGALGVGELVAAILEWSDNTAANLLLRRLGGPPALTAWLRTTGDAVTVIGRYEIIPNQTGPVNSSTPRAIAATASRISLGDLLRPSTRALNNRWMAANALGPHRLRGGMPPSWRGIDRTGTLDDVRNDYAIAWPPGRAPVVIAAYYEKPDLADDEGEAVLRQVGAAIARWLG